MKQKLGVILATTLLIGIVVGCGNKAQDNSEVSTLKEIDESKETIEQVSENRIYTDKAGREIEIPANLERVVTISSTPEAVALGLLPVGAADNWLKSLEEAQKEGIESVGELKGLNLEKILALEPQIIIVPERVTEEETIEALSKIAPTVVGPFYGDAFDNLRTIGDILGKEQEAQAWIAEYEAKAKETKEELAGVFEEGKTALVIQLSASAKNGSYLYPASTWPTIYDVLGLELPQANELKEQTAGAELSMEKLAEYNPDYIFLTSGDDASMEKLKEEFTKNSVWQQLLAVENNHVYTMGERLSSGDVLTLEWALKDLVRAVEEVRE